MTWNHPHAMFRSGVRHEKRPRSNNKTAQLAWDYFAKDGPVEWIQLLDGYWGCQRPGGGDIEETDNTFSSRYR